MTAPSNVTYEIGELRIDTGRRVLLSARSGAPIPLPHKVFETLLYFVDHRVGPDCAQEHRFLEQLAPVLDEVEQCFEDFVWQRNRCAAARG